jgi:hypothetical protein
MKKAKKVIASFGLSAMMFQVLVTPASAISLEISGNGVEADNDVVIETEHKTEVNQSNEFNVDNNINASASTGGNEANRNTGGDASVSTGDATSTVGVSNAGNTNEALVDCCSSAQNVDILISENGDSTDNKVKLENENKIEVNQDNESNVDNKIKNNASTGWNDANRNTGGSVSVTTGAATVATAVFNGGNINSAVVSGGGEQAGGVSARILGNGVDSDNEIDLDLEHKVELNQENSARIDNYVDADAVTGKNNANRNTGGDVIIDTGDAEVGVIVDNAVNFNYADVDCGCLFDITAKIAGNGDSSDNKIKADLEDKLEVAQENSCDGGSHRGGPYRVFELLKVRSPRHHGGDCIENDIYADAYSGFNDANKNTGEADSDPSVDTGNASTTVDVENAGNSNVFGEASDWEYPEGENHSNVSVNLSFDLANLLDLLGLLS